jgi:hypothetical protein
MMISYLPIDEREWHVYALSDPRAPGVPRYVGVTFRGVARRVVEHTCRARTGGRTHRDCWLRSLLTAGVEPNVDVVQSGRGEGWQDAERSWIAKHRPTLVNATDGGDGAPGLVCSESAKAAMSRARRGKTYAPGRVPGMLGRTHSPEARAKIADAGRGRAHTPQSKALLSAARSGKALSKGHRAKLRERKLGGTLTPEHRQKIAASTTTRVPVRCIETGEVYPSVTAAARALGANESSVYQACRRGVRCRGVHLERISL